MTKKPFFLTTALACTLALPAMAQDLPGEGKEVRLSRSDSLGTQYVQAEILKRAMEDLGYDVTDLLEAKGYDPVKMVKTGEGFYSSRRRRAIWTSRATSTCRSAPCSMIR